MEPSGVPSQRRMSGRKPQGLGQRRRLNTHVEKMTKPQGESVDKDLQRIPEHVSWGRSKFQGWGWLMGKSCK